MYNAITNICMINIYKYEQLFEGDCIDRYIK